MRGGGGLLLFKFYAHEDVRMGTIESRVEKDESHPGKVVERRWYERNRHISPRAGDGCYTTHGGETTKEVVAGFLYIWTL